MASHGHGGAHRGQCPGRRLQYSAIYLPFFCMHTYIERAVATMCCGAASPDRAERRIVVGFVITIALANMKDNTCVAHRTAIASACRRANDRLLFAAVAGAGDGGGGGGAATAAAFIVARSYGVWWPA